MTDSPSKPPIYQVLLIATSSLILNYVGLLAWIVVMSTGMIVTKISFGFAQSGDFPSMACASARNLIVYGLLPLCAFPVAFYGLSFLIDQEKTFKGYTATSCAIGSMIIWLGWAAFVWLQPPHPHYGCGFGGPELLFPFPFFEILVLNTLGQSWAAYKIRTHQSNLSLISLLRKRISR